MDTMHSYSKLFQEILDSSVWQQPLHVKVMWVTMLAMKSPGDQIVRASVPGLAKRAGVTIEQCLEALEIFKSPDPYSRIKDHDGRKIEDVREGWHVLNGAEYQRRMSDEDIRAAWREQKARERARVAEAPAVSPSPEPCPKPNSPGCNGDFDAFWQAYPRKVGKGAAEKAWKKNGRPELAVILAAVEKAKGCEQWRKDGGQFIPHPATWLNQKRWLDDASADMGNPITEQPPMTDAEIIRASQ